MKEYYPAVGFHFSVRFDVPGAGDEETRFSEVSGISMELETESYVEGGENRFTHKLPVRASYPDLVLKRGHLTNSKIRKWFESAIYNLNILPVTVWVSLLNENHEPLQSYTFINAYPKKWSISDMNAANSSLVIESMELSYQYFKIN